MLVAVVVGCAETLFDPAPTPTVEGYRRIVPSEGLPEQVVPQPANNNLDVVDHDGRLFLAFRSAPTHFASDETVMHVVSTDDEESWRFEGSFTVGMDVREPQLVSFGGELRLWYAVLGDSAIEFEPGRTEIVTYRGPGDWSGPELWPDVGFIPWRIDEHDGRLHLTGYTGGENIYDADGEPIEVRWLVSDDGRTWEPAAGGDDPVVLVGGTSETDLDFLADGSIVAVSRNEAGDELGFGSRICRAPADDLGTWSCADDPRKYDSPLVFRRGEGDDLRFWLVGRRNVTEDGAFDLGMDDLSLQDQFLQYSVTYWNEPKRCSLWEVDPFRMEVHFVLDLPSKGDTCFPEIVDRGDHVLLYNYSSDPEGPELTWLEGQLAPTGIDRMELWNL